VRARPAAPLFAILLATLLINLPTWNQPFGRDQGIFAYIGDGVRQGYVPYRDSWDHKPPGIDFAYATAFTLFGRTMPAVHALETLSILATVVVLAALGGRLFGRGVGLTAAALYGLGSTLQFEWWDRVQAETFMALPLTVAAFAAVRRGQGGGAGWAVLAGLATGVALVFKPTAATAALFAPVAFAAGPAGKPRRAAPALARRLAGDLTLYGLGVAAALAPVALYFGVNGALRDLWDTVIVFNQTHVQTGTNLSLEAIALATWDFGRRMGPLGLLAALGMAGWGLRGADLTPDARCAGTRPWREGVPTSEALGPTQSPGSPGMLAQGTPSLQGRVPAQRASGVRSRPPIRNPQSAILAVTWLLACLAGVWVQGKFFSYHWSVAVPALALAAAAGLARLWADWRAASGVLYRAPRLAVYGLVALAYLAVVWQDQSNGKLGRDLAYLLRRSDAPAYQAQFGHNLRGADIYSFVEARDTAAYLAAHTRREDTVLVWGFQALVNFLADRRAPTAYVFDYPLTIQQEESDYRDQARARFLADLAAHPPRYIVIVRNDVNPLQTVDSETLLAEFPEFKAQLERDYAPETEIGNFQVRRRKDDGR
jgi:4-amino-4-deoxy-L-arabinose transferase-like glycosyltransferase